MLIARMIPLKYDISQKGGAQTSEIWRIGYQAHLLPP